MGSKVKWVRLGDYIEKCDERNTEGKYGVPELRGVNNDHEFCYSKAKTQGVDFTPYKVVRYNNFVYNPARLDIGSWALYKGELCIVSTLYVVFKIKEEYKKELIPEFLTMYFGREEFNRYISYSNWGSAREYFWYNDMAEVFIPLPSPEEQQKVVNAWKACREIKEQNEAKAAPLMQLCQSYIQELKHKTKTTYRIGKAIQIQDQTNTDNITWEVLGLNRDKEFMPTVANLESVSLRKYKVITKGQFAYSGMQTGRDICIRISLYNKDNPALISPAYTTFTLKEEEPLLPEFMMLVFKNPEMDRLGWFYSDSSVRSNLDWNRFLDIEIPYVPLDVQRAIVNIYRCANEAKQIAAEADRLSREVCPALIQHVKNC